MDSVPGSVADSKTAKGEAKPSITSVHVKKGVEDTLTANENVRRVSYNMDPRRDKMSQRTLEYNGEINSAIRGIDHMRDPKMNKDMAFTIEERQVLGINGLLPPKVQTQEDQMKLCKAQIDCCNSELDKYIYLSELQARNERLFYRLCSENVEQMMPLLYTPTVGLACQKFGQIYRQPRGLFITINDRGHVYDVLKNWPHSEVRAICVTDGERILGLGDLGANGMGIPIGKLALYTLCAGIKPFQCLPITLDVGTNNQALLEDPFYIGINQRRVQGAVYDDFIEEFMQAVVRRFGQHCLIQFEDFGNQNAFRLLERYRNKYCTFNDDIQGTAAVVVAGLNAAFRITKTKMADNVFLFMGAGEASLGTAMLIVREMIKENGVSRKDALSKIWLADSKGLVCTSRADLSDEKKVFAQDSPQQIDFLEIMKVAKPTAIIGASAQPGAFNKNIIRYMAKINKRPVIFALSNPTSKAECTAAEAYTVSEGRAIFASGSPFPPFDHKGQTFVPGQGNNSYIFPGVALGAITAGIRHISEDVFLLAATTLAKYVADEDLLLGRVYPPLTDIRKVSLVIAKNICEDAYAKGLATTYPEPADKAEFIKAQLYEYKYSKSIPCSYSWPR